MLTLMFKIQNEIGDKSVQYSSDKKGWGMCFGLSWEVRRLSQQVIKRGIFQSLKELPHYTAMVGGPHYNTNYFLSRISWKKIHVVICFLFYYFSSWSLDDSMISFWIISVLDMLKIPCVMLDWSHFQGWSGGVNKWLFQPQGHFVTRIFTNIRV